MTGRGRHPDLEAALDPRLSIADRRQAYARWQKAQATVWHIHPGQPAHGHPGGGGIHTHDPKENR